MPAEDKLKTNRDFYQHVFKLIHSKRNDDTGLEVFLRALLGASRGLSDRPALNLEEFLGLLNSSFEVDPVPFDEEWRQLADIEKDGLGSYAAWERTLISQIVDLREMAEGGAIDDEMNWFGTSSPRGNEWCNFAPGGYLECAVRGSFGGWEPEDGIVEVIGQDHLPIQHEDGTIEFAKVKVELEPALEIEFVSWDDFCQFLLCGRAYE